MKLRKTILASIEFYKRSGKVRNVDGEVTYRIVSGEETLWTVIKHLEKRTRNLAVHIGLALSRISDNSERIEVISTSLVNLTESYYRLLNRCEQLELELKLQKDELLELITLTTEGFATVKNRLNESGPFEFEMSKDEEQS